MYYNYFISDYPLEKYDVTTRHNIIIILLRYVYTVLHLLQTTPPPPHCQIRELPLRLRSLHRIHLEIRRLRYQHHRRDITRSFVVTLTNTAIYLFGYHAFNIHKMSILRRTQLSIDGQLMKTYFVMGFLEHLRQWVPLIILVSLQTFLSRKSNIVCEFDINHVQFSMLATIGYLVAQKLHSTFGGEFMDLPTVTSLKYNIFLLFSLQFQYQVLVQKNVIVCVQDRKSPWMW